MRWFLRWYQPWLLALLLHDHDATGFAGHRTADVDQVALHVDLFDAEVRLRVTRIAVVARHLLALDDARRVGAWSDRTRTTVLRVAVRVRSTADAVALHDALKAATLRRPDDLDGVTDGEDVDLHDVADVVRRILGLGVARLVETDGAQRARHVLEAGLLCMADRGERRAMALHDLLLTACALATQARRTEAKLNGRMADLGLVRPTAHRIRFGFDHRHRDLLPLFVEDLGHAQLLPNDSDHMELSISS